jgi:hypothetical protein
MTLNLSNKQVTKMAKLAILASVPVGMGFLHYRPDLKEEDMTNVDATDGHIYIDYYQGRMVKFNGERNLDGTWKFPDNTSYEYQSWKQVYPSYAELAEKVKDVQD